MVDHSDYQQIDGHEETLAARQRGPEYTELEIAERNTISEDARFYEEFATYDPPNVKAPVWKRRRFNLIHICLVAVGCLGVYIAVSILWSSAIAGDKTTEPTVNSPVGTEPLPSNNEPAGRSRKKLLTYDSVGLVNGQVQTKTLDWIKHPSEDIDGLFREAVDDMFVVHKIDNKTWEHRLATHSDLDAAARALGVEFTPLAWSLSADWEFMLFKIQSQRVWRHSERGTYMIYNIRERTLAPLTQTDNDRVQRVDWAPVGHRLQFVRDNNLFVTDTQHEIQVTDDGSQSVFNGVADWVYEEEVLGSAASSLWSPDGNAVAFMRLDDTPVPVFQYELFHPENRSVVYPDTISLHYPKAGAPNPLVSLYIYRPDFGVSAPRASDNPDTAFHPQLVSFDAPFAPEDFLITNVVWLTDHSDRLLVYVMNRVQDHFKVYVVNADSKNLTAHKVREHASDDGAWIEINSSPLYVPQASVPSLTADAYIDLVEHGEHTHLALFSPPDASEPTRWLTSGDYDVVSDSVSFSPRSARVSFLSTRESSISFNLYQVALDAEGLHSLSPPPAAGPAIRTRLGSDSARNSTYEASISAEGGFYLLNYKGPRVPWQAVYSLSNPEFEVVVNDNSVAKNLLDAFSLPTVEFTEIANDAGDTMNAMITYPPDFDRNAKAKYGVLFHVYGGPNSQQVSQAFSLDWMSALVSQRDVPDMPWIVVRVDGRGTGYRGRRFRSAVSKQLGILEPADQAAAARFLQTQPYVNPHRIAIWGWSYGGYTTARAIERHSDVFRVGMSVAPVTSWRFYDSVYTERYMKTPRANEAGYDASTVTNTTGFSSSRFLVQHGTGDDNVHLQNTLALVDLLESKNVPGFEMAVYTDSDHSIYTHGTTLRTGTQRAQLLQRLPAITAHQLIARRLITDRAKSIIDDAVKDNDMVVFMKGTPDEPMCGFSRAVIQILQMHGVDQIVGVDCLQDPEIREGIKEYTDWPTIPQVYIKGEFVGGCDVMVQMHQSGELHELLVKEKILSEEPDQEK
ncbi:Dpp4p [Coemansia sp. RSA 990]|nr:Dpp4p [Coemansia sp. RSA 990]